MFNNVKNSFLSRILLKLAQTLCQSWRVLLDHVSVTMVRAPKSGPGVLFTAIKIIITVKHVFQNKFIFLPGLIPMLHQVKSETGPKKNADRQPRKDNLVKKKKKNSQGMKTKFQSQKLKLKGAKHFHGGSTTIWRQTGRNEPLFAQPITPYKLQVREVVFQTCLPGRGKRTGKSTLNPTQIDSQCRSALLE